MDHNLLERVVFRIIEPNYAVVRAPFGYLSLRWSQETIQRLSLIKCSNAGGLIGQLSDTSLLERSIDQNEGIGG